MTDQPLVVCQLIMARREGFELSDMKTITFSVSYNSKIRVFLHRFLNFFRAPFPFRPSFYLLFPSCKGYFKG